MIWASWLSSWGCSEECEKWCSFITNQVCKRSYSEVQDGRCKPSSNTNVKWVKFVYHIEVLLEHFNFTITQPDLSFSVSKIFQSLHQPLNTLLKSVRSILRYVKGVMDQGITSQRSSYLLTSYRDADWVTSPDDRCFVSLFFLFFCFLERNNFLKLKKQPTESRSHVETNYRSLANLAVEIMWGQSLLGELNIGFPLGPTLWCNILIPIALSTNFFLTHKQST